MAELPLVIVNMQRGGPSTGLPTKTEQADLLQAIFGRNGEAPLPIVAPGTPGDCFYAAFEACRIAVKYMTPVILLSDGYLGTGSEPWLIPNVDDLENFEPSFASAPNRTVEGEDVFLPYIRDKKTLARPWAKPGTAGLEHRLGGLEKEHETGNVSYEPENHEYMVKLRAEKVQRVAQDISAAGGVRRTGRGSAGCRLGIDAGRDRDRGGCLCGTRPQSRRNASSAHCAVAE